MRPLLFMLKWLFWALLLAPTAQAEQFVSLTLCSDRLLLELARPEQIAAMSPYSQKPLMMLDKINHDKPVVEARLPDLLPYLDKTLLLNETFYPQLVTQLKAMGVRIVPINDSPQTPEELFALIHQLGEITHNQTQAQTLVAQLQQQHFKLNRHAKQTLILSETGVVESYYPQYPVLLALLGLEPLAMPLSAQNFSLEKLLLSQANILLELNDKAAYSAQAALFAQPLLNDYFPPQNRAQIPMKYTYCFDHGLWQGAALIYQQLNDATFHSH